MMVVALLAGAAGGWGIGGFIQRVAARQAGAGTLQAPPRPPASLANRGATAPVSDQTRHDWQAGLETAADCRRLVESLRDTPRTDHPLFTSALRDYALRRWLELDPEDALAFAEKAGGRWHESPLAGDLFRLWVGLDADSALNAFAQASPATVMAARRDFFTKLAEIDPRRAVEVMENPRWNSAIAEWDQTSERVYSLWAEKEPEAAAERVLAIDVTINSGHAKSRAVQTVAETWARRDPEAAWRFFQPDPGKNYRLDVAVAILPHLLKIDPTAMGRVDDKLTPDLAKAWTDRNPEDAIAFAQSRPTEDPLRRELFAHAARTLATAEPERAIQLYRESGGGSAHEWENSGLLREAFASLAGHDRQQAASKMLEFSGKDREAAMSGVLTHAFASDIAGASALARSWWNNPSLEQAVTPALGVALSWGHGGGNVDLGPILEQMPELADHVSGYLLQGWTRTNPEAAAAFLETKVAANPDFAMNDAEALAEICFSRPEFTAHWLGQLPAGAFQTTTAGTLARTWSRFDPEAANDWAQSLPEGPPKEAALKALGPPSPKH
jgi:hypothetical protein